jgi:Tol biopolymer transport system component
VREVATKATGGSGGGAPAGARGEPLANRAGERVQPGAPWAAKGAWRWRLATLATLLLLLATATSAAAAERHFPETSQTTRGAFLDFFDAHGGLDIFGYPRTGEILEKGRTVQYFQRARFEWWPENPAGFQVQLGLLADELGRGRPPTMQSSDPTRRYFPETQHSIGGAFRDFFEQRGGLAVFGYPTTDEISENGRAVQYFQRARFEWHGENEPKYRVQLGLLGDELLGIRGDSASGEGWLVVSTGVGGDFFLMRPNGADQRKLGRGVDPSLSPDGKWVVFGLEDVADPGLYVQSTDPGGEPKLIWAGKGGRGPLFSPDGGEIVFYQRSDCLRRIGREDFENDSCFQILILPAGGGQTYLPPGQGRYAQQPTWSPDGKRIVYKEEKALFVVPRDGSVTARQLSEFQPYYLTPLWSPLGGKLAVARDMNRSHYEVGLIPDDGSVDFVQLTKSAPFRQPPATSLSPAWSPDGSKIAFVSDRDGALRVWVMSADGSGAAKVSDLPISSNGTRERLVHWSRGP